MRILSWMAAGALASAATACSERSSPAPGAGEAGAGLVGVEDDLPAAREGVVLLDDELIAVDSAPRDRNGIVDDGDPFADDLIEEEPPTWP